MLSAGVESASSGSWPCSKILRSRCSSLIASRVDQGDLPSAGWMRVASGQRLDQSERTMTTLPAGILPFVRSHETTGEEAICLSGGVGLLQVFCNRGTIGTLANVSVVITLQREPSQHSATATRYE